MDPLNIIKEASRVSGLNLDRIGKTLEAQADNELRRLQLEESAIQADRNFRLTEQTQRASMESRQFRDELAVVSAKIEADQFQRKSVVDGLQTQLKAITDEEENITDLLLFQKITGDPKLTETEARLEALTRRKEMINRQSMQVMAGTPVYEIPEAPAVSYHSLPGRQNGELGFKGFPPLSGTELTINQTGVNLPGRNVERYATYGDSQISNFTEMRPMRVTAFGYAGDPYEATDGTGSHTTFRGKKLNSNSEAYASMPYSALQEIGIPMGSDGRPMFRGDGEKQIIEDYVAAVRLPDGSVKTFPVRDIGPALNNEAVDLSAAALRQVGREVTGPNSISDDSPLNVQYIHKDTLKEWIAATTVSSGLFPQDPDFGIESDEPQLRAEPIVPDDPEYEAEVDFEGDGPASYRPATLPEGATEDPSQSTPLNPPQPSEPKNEPLTKDQVKNLYLEASTRYLGSTNGAAKVARVTQLLGDRVRRENPTMFNDELRSIARVAIANGTSYPEAVKGVPDYIKAIVGESEFNLVYQDLQLEDTRNKEREAALKALQSEDDDLLLRIQKEKKEQAKEQDSNNPRPGLLSQYQQNIEYLESKRAEVNEKILALDPPPTKVEINQKDVDREQRFAEVAAAVGGDPLDPSNPYSNDEESTPEDEEATPKDETINNLYSSLSNTLGLDVAELPAFEVGGDPSLAQRAFSGGGSEELHGWVRQVANKSYQQALSVYGNFSDEQKGLASNMEVSWDEITKMADLYAEIYPDKKSLENSQRFNEIYNLINNDAGVKYSLLRMVRRNEWNTIETQAKQARVKSYHAKRKLNATRAETLLNLPKDSSD